MFAFRLEGLGAVGGDVVCLCVAIILGNEGDGAKTLAYDRAREMAGYGLRGTGERKGCRL